MMTELKGHCQIRLLIVLRAHLYVVLRAHLHRVL